jgi:hypothetical protein
MSDKWRWILLVWHDWRCNVWNAESYLRDEPRKKHAQVMRDYHMDRAGEMHRALFPPPPIDFQNLFEKMKRTAIKRSD